MKGGSTGSKENAPSSAWNIKTVSPMEYLEKLHTKGEIILPIDSDFTFLRRAKRKDYEIGEIAKALGKPLDDVVTFSLQRMAFFETVAVMETEVQLDDPDKELKPKVLAAWKAFDAQVNPKEEEAQESKDEHFKRKRREKEEEYFHQIEAEIESKAKGIIDSISLGKKDPSLNIYMQEYDEITNEITKRISEGKYKLGELNPDIKNVSQIASQILYDRIYRQLALEEIENDMMPTMREIFWEQENTPIENIPCKKRHTFMILGAPSSGKGTSCGMIEVQAKERFGIEWKNLIKLDTDVHRRIVTDPKVLGEDKTLFADLCNLESRYISLRVEDRLKAMIKQGSAPHCLIDGVQMSEDRIKLALMAGGQAHVAMVSVPVERCVERAYARGKETGRFVTTGYLINANKGISESLFSTLAKHGGEEIEFALLDNDVPKGEPPILIAGSLLAEKKFTIYDRKRLEVFYAKRLVNSKAKSTEELYEDLPSTKGDFEKIILEFESKGYAIEHAYLGPKREMLHAKASAAKDRQKSSTVLHENKSRAKQKPKN